MGTAVTPSLFSILYVATRWSVSKDSIRRLLDSGQLGCVRIGSRRLVPLSEIERAEQFGMGKLAKKGGR